MSKGDGALKDTVPLQPSPPKLLMVGLSNHENGSTP
jgi:hypothetical protein